jgi:ribosomal protein S18 acetylase RimI-like enzyme
MMVLRAPRIDFAPACPEGCALARVAGVASATDHDLAEEAMREAGEPNGQVAPRLAHGDEFFGWLVGGRVLSFGWVTYHDRTVGPVQLAEASGRAFLYNFHTLEEYRGRGLYPALLLTMRHVLGREKVTEFVIDVDVRNTASVRGIEKGGFVLMAQVSFLTLFARWRCLATQTVLGRTASYQNGASPRASFRESRFSDPIGAKWQRAVFDSDIAMYSTGQDRFFMEAPTLNRRSAPRAKISLPIRVRPFDSKYPEEICTTLNMSRNGLFFATSTGHYLELYFLHMKVHVMRNFQPNDPVNQEEIGDVVRVEGPRDGKLGVAICIATVTKSGARSGA